MFIRTHRLFLRPAWREDAAAVHAAIADWEIVRNLARAPWPYTRADAEAFCDGQTLGPGETALLIWLRTDAAPELVGCIGVHYARSGPELGYWIATQHQRRGYVGEAARAVLDLAFTGLGHAALAAGHYIDNPASGRVLAALGFEPTGEVIPYACTARGCEVPSVEYRLTRDRWAVGAGYALAA